MEISSIGPLSISNVASTAGQTGAAGSAQKLAGTFSQMLDDLNQSQQSADDLSQQLAMGENVDLHQVMIGMEENDVNFRVALAIRDRLVDAYREVMRISV